MWEMELSCLFGVGFGKILTHVDKREFGICLFAKLTICKDGICEREIMCVCVCVGVWERENGSETNVASGLWQEEERGGIQHHESYISRDLDSDYGVGGGSIVIRLRLHKLIGLLKRPPVSFSFDVKMQNGLFISTLNCRTMKPWDDFSIEDKAF